jgi:hypothetical protein
VASAVAAVVIILIVYVLEYPGQFRVLVDIFLFRTGLSTRFPETMFSVEMDRPSPYLFLRTVGARLVGLLGWAPVLGGLGLAVHSIRRVLTRSLAGTDIFVAAFGTLWAGWILCFHSHYFIHSDLMTELGLPLAATGFGWIIARLVKITEARFASGFALAPALVAVCVPVALLTTFTGRLRADVMERLHRTPQSTAEIAAGNTMIGLSQEIKRLSPPGSTVLTPELDTVVLYYSERHVITGVASDRDVARAWDQATAASPTSPVFLALRAKDRAAFEKTLAAARLLPANGDAAVAVLEKTDPQAQR